MTIHSGQLAKNRRGLEQSDCLIQRKHYDQYDFCPAWVNGGCNYDYLNQAGYLVI